MTDKPKTTIPVRLELEYMLDQKRLIRNLSFLTVASLHKRTDSDELLAFLSLTAPQVLDNRRLRRRLRQIAHEMTNEKMTELAKLLGRGVRRPLPGTITKWVDEQVTAVQFTIEHWLLAANEEIRASRLKGMPPAEMTIALRARAKIASRNATTRASAAILQLNSELIQQIARGAGSSHYRWTTEQDDRVRVNHVPLHFTVQKWTEPPGGGGTKPDDSGHPGSGFGCRCTAIPLQGVPPA
jgi:DNA-directed RNA polymerase subunit L